MASVNPGPSSSSTVNTQTPTVALTTSAAAGAFATGNQIPVANSKMQIDNLIEVTPNGYLLQTEATIWQSTAYTFGAFSKEMTAATVSGQGSSGPLTTLFAFANNNGATANVVSFVADAVARQANGTVFAANFICRSDSAVTNAKLVGLEIDIEPASGQVPNNNSAGILFNIFNVAGSDPTPVCQVNGVGGGQWGNGFLTAQIIGAHYAVQSSNTVTSRSFIDTRNGTFSQTAIVLGSTASQGIYFGGVTFGTNPLLYADGSHNATLNLGSGNFNFNNTSGVTKAAVTQAGAFNTISAGFQFNSVQVVGAQITGYGTPTGGVNQGSFAAGSITLANLAAGVAQLILDLKTHGLLGT